MAYGYRLMKIPKGNGKFRVIHIPHPKLKDRLRRLLKIITSLAIPAGPHIHAYVRRRNIVTNARKLQVYDPGTKKFLTPKYLLKLDVKDFFNSLTEEVVMAACVKAKIPQRICDRLSQHCFVNFNGKRVLPQGSPCSPFLSNLVMRQIAARIHGFLKVMNDGTMYPILFSIYCDNLSFTCDSPRVNGLLRPIARILADYGLEINRKKIELHAPPARKVVCGVQLNPEKLSPVKPYWRNLRAEIANAIIDRKAGYVPKGLRLKHDVRQQIRDQFVPRTPGKIQRIFPAFVQPFLKPENMEPIPESEWMGKIAFIRSIDTKRADDLQKLVVELQNT